jgi:hypothetical protein
MSPIDFIVVWIDMEEIEAVVGSVIFRKWSVPIEGVKK